MVQYNSGLPKVFTITSYGADPTGVADSTAAITAAKTAAGAGTRNIIAVPPGTYLCGPFTLDGFYWLGAGPQSSIFKAKAGSSNWVTNNPVATTEVETVVEKIGFNGANLTGSATVFKWGATNPGLNAPTVIVRDCWMYNGPANGVDAGPGGALSDNIYDNVTAYNNGAIGFVIGNDVIYLGCTAANNIGNGFDSANASSFSLTGCKAYGNAYGYHLYGATAGGTVAGCNAQDNQLAGVLFDTTAGNGGGYTVTGMVCDSNSRIGAGSYAAVEFFDAVNNRADFMAVDRNPGGTNYQLNALGFQSGSTGNLIDCGAFYKTGGSGSLAWFRVGNGSGNAMRLNNSPGLQAPVFASTITPDVPTGGVVNVGALTGNITIGVPTNPWVGATLTFEFTQDGTGGRTVTWNAIFKFQAAWTNSGNTLNKQSTASFVYDGTNWVSQNHAANVWF